MAILPSSGEGMGLILSRDADTRSIKKAQRCIDDAEQMILKNELERAKGEIRRGQRELGRMLRSRRPTPTSVRRLRSIGRGHAPLQHER